MIKSHLFFLMGILITVNAFSQVIDSSAIKVYPRTDVIYDSLTTFSYSKQYETQNLLYAGAKPHTLFVGVNFGFGTMFNADIKSNYPGFIGVGLEGGIKFNNGFIIEGEWRFNQFQRNVNYNYTTKLNNGSIVRYQVRDAALEMNHFVLCLLYTDFRSPFIAFRYFYGGVGIGMVEVRERRNLTKTELINSLEVISADTNPYEEWSPNMSLIFGMNFLYLPQSHNWFSIDVRFDYTFNNKQNSEGTILEKQAELTGINTTVRFYFDLTR
jgi:hypothetical protein